MVCKPNEEAAAAGEFLSMLSDLARRAGGETPLPERPDTSHLLDLQSLAGNEQLVGILKLGSVTLRTTEDVKAWVTKTERELLEHLTQGPIVVG